MIKFNEKYNKADFLSFLEDFLPEDFVEDEKDILINDRYKIITKAKELGSCRSLDLVVLEMDHNKEKDPRIAIATDAFKIMADHWVHNALVIFKNNDSENYRFSYLTISLESDDGSNVAKKYSNARRRSFYLGVNAKVKTAENFLIKKGRVKNLEDLLNRFNVEIVTKEFYQNYKELFESLLGHLKSDKAFNAFAGKHGLKLEIFAKKLLGQIVFIYFLQKKGWLGARRGEYISKGDAQFLRNIFIKCQKENKNFFNDYLEHLFYECLNSLPKMAGSFYREKFDCQIPFLNGGLFEPVNDYNWQNEFISIPNEIFSNNENTGILDIFDLYNFTIDENTPDDQEVSVDPEMLGKVFENLLEDNVRKGQGAFYTPREIVQYMCRESLVNYLVSNHSNLSEKNIREYVTYGVALSRDVAELKEIWKGGSYAPGQFKELDDLLKNAKIVDPACGSGAFLVGMLQEIIRLRVFLQLTPDSELFLKSPDSIKELSVYELKKETIQNSLYGVDIDPGAVDIAKLRFWLSIVVEEDVDEVEPLPNLDYKIMQGNSLLEDLVIGDSVIKFDFSGGKKLDKRTKEQKELFKLGGIQGKLILDQSDNLTDKLEKLHAEFFSIFDPDKKKILKRKIDNIEDELIQSKCHEEIKNAESFVQNSVNDSKKILKGTEKMLAVKSVLDKWKKDHLRPFFPWKLHFGEVFNKEESGFDIVIGNPPYIKEYTSKDAFRDLKTSPYYQGKMDLWYFFACYGLDFLKNNGVQAFIAPNNWVSNYGAKIMRNKILNEAKICQFLDFGNYKVFDTAGIQTMVYLLKKNNDNKSYKLKIGKLKNENPNSDILSGFLNTEFNENNDNFGKFEIEFAKKNFIDKTIQFLDAEIDTITNKIENNGNFYLLSDEVANGIHPHFDFVNKKQLPVLKKDFSVGDGIFGLSDEEKNELNLQENEKDIVKPYYLTSEFFKYGSMRNNTHWIIYTDSRFKNKDEMEKYPNIKKHLDKFVKVITSDNKPYGLHRARDEKFFKGEKIVVARKCISPEFSYNDFNCYVSATFYVIKSDRINLKYLLAILNSKLIKYWLMHKGKMQGNNYQIDKEPILQIPIAIVSKKNQEEIILLIDQILKIKGQDQKADTENFEDKIDQLVYQLYDLTEEEIKNIKNE